MTTKDRKIREAELLIRARIGRAIDRAISARLSLDDHGISERVEVEIVAALSELDQAERLVSVTRLELGT